MKLKIIVKLLILGLLIAPDAGAAVIKSIEIQRRNVFDNELQEYDWFIYRIGNTVHRVTREWVIRDELLYDVGDELDSLKIIETERNLRALEFIGDVRSDLEYNEDSSAVDLRLTTSDQWSTIIGPISEGGGGDYTIGFAVNETNILGWGKDIRLEMFTGSELSGHYLNYSDRNFFRTRLWGFFEWENDGYIKSIGYGLKRPFYSLDDRYSFIVEGYNSDGAIRYFSGGVELFRYTSAVNIYSGSVTRSFGKRFKRNVTLAFSRREQNYSLNPVLNRYSSLVPPDEAETRLDMNLHFGIYNYDSTTFLDNFGNVEDLTMGWWVNMSMGRALDILGGDIVRSYGKAVVSTVFEYPPDLFWAGSFLAQARYDDDFDNIIYRPRLVAYFKYPQRMITAVRLESRFYDHPDPYLVNYLGGKSGLRGYESYEAAGQNYVLANFEERYYSPLEILTVAFGVVAFVDIGKTWYEFEGYDAREWKSDAGIGLRFGLTKSSGFKVVRFDIAHSLTDNIFLISFGTEMFFKFGT
jgi:outer membrane protein assembly factor BamA